MQGFIKMMSNDEYLDNFGHLKHIGHFGQPFGLALYFGLDRIKKMCESYTTSMYALRHQLSRSFEQLLTLALTAVRTEPGLNRHRNLLFGYAVADNSVIYE